MKKTIILILPFIVLISCNNIEKQKRIEREKTINDSIQQAEKLQKDKELAEEKVRIDSLSQIAWGEAKFGMSVKDVKATKAFKNAFGFRDKNNPFQSLELTLADTNIDGIYSIKVSFFNDRLFRVDMESWTRNANYYDTEIKETVDELKNLIQEKYGEPTVNNGFPDFIELKPDRPITAYSWTVGEKRIYIDVKEIYSGSEYKVECIILHSKETEAVSSYNDKLEQETKSKKSNGF